MPLPAPSPGLKTWAELQVFGLMFSVRKSVLENDPEYRRKQHERNKEEYWQAGEIANWNLNRVAGQVRREMKAFPRSFPYSSA